MTSEVTQAALEPCPVCGQQPRWRGTRSDYARGIFRLQCLGETHLFQAYGPDEKAAIAAWNTRLTAQSGEGISPPTQRMAETLGARFVMSGEGRSGAGEDVEAVLRDPNAVHVNMLRGGIARPSFAQIIHIYGEEALLAALNAGQSGEGEREALADHFPTGLRSGYARTAGGIPVQGGGIEVDCRCGWSTKAADEHEVREEWAAHVLAALRATDDAGGA